MKRKANEVNKNKAERERTYDIYEGSMKYEDEKQNSEYAELSLFYRLFKFTLHSDRKSQRFIYQIAIFILNKIYQYKTIPDSEEEKCMAFDMFMETEPGKKFQQSNSSQISRFTNDRKDKLIDFVKEIISKIIEGKIDSDDGDALFKINTRDDQNIYRSDGANCELSSEIKYLLFEIVNIIKNASKSYSSNNIIY